MPDQPYTIRDGWYRDEGGAYWQAVGVAGMPAYEPCFVVTGDLDAARRRLAPLPADTRTRAIEAIREVMIGGAASPTASVDALVAAGMIRPAHDAADWRLIARTFSRIADLLECADGNEELNLERAYRLACKAWRRALAAAEKGEA